LRGFPQTTHTSFGLFDFLDFITDIMAEFL